MQGWVSGWACGLYCDPVGAQRRAEVGGGGGGKGLSDLNNNIQKVNSHS